MLKNNVKVELDDDIKTKLPLALAIQKKKLLIAINKNTDDTVDSISAEDEQLVETVSEALTKIVYPSSQNSGSLQLESLEASKHVQTTLEKHTVFKLTQYLKFAIDVCYCFSIKNCIPKSIETALEYLFTHARQFGDPTKTMFKNIEATADPIKDTVSVNEPLMKRISIKSNIMKRTVQLIKELAQDYDDTKYQVLNGYITSLVLLLLRRQLKRHISDWGHLNMRYLVIYAYLNTEDQKTKMNLKDTCVKYMEWHDMQLPCLFFKVAEMYGIEEGRLWDILCTICSKKIRISLMDLATEYYNNYQLSKSELSQGQCWFPYCRGFCFNDTLFEKESKLYKKLSNNKNSVICTLLSEVVGKNSALLEPMYKYTSPSRNVNEWAQEAAKKIMLLIKK